MDWNSGVCRNPQQMAEILKNIYQEEFGGKLRGRFRTSRKNFRKLANLPLLTEDYIREVTLWLRKKDLVLVDIDYAFLVFPLKARSWRRVTNSVIEQYLELSEEDSDDFNDDD